MTTPNVSHTEAYSVYDHVFLKALRSVSRVFSVAQLTRPFWNRWRAGDVGDEVLFGFLNAIRNLDDWPAAAERMIARDAGSGQNMGVMRRVFGLRRSAGHRELRPL